MFYKVTKLDIFAWIRFLDGLIGVAAHGACAFGAGKFNTSTSICEQVAQPLREWQRRDNVIERHSTAGKARSSNKRQSTFSSLGYLSHLILQSDLCVPRQCIYFTARPHRIACTSRARLVFLSTRSEQGTNNPRKPHPTTGPPSTMSGNTTTDLRKKDWADESDGDDDPEELRRQFGSPSRPKSGQDEEPSE
jgi:hypothetical protein